jgi:ABC-type uncharacterized transport system fused permease/ATPase subunit
MRSQIERIAILESTSEETKQTLEAIDKKLDQLHADMTRYKGFLGGVTFVGSCVMAFLALGKEWILSRMR